MSKEDTTAFQEAGQNPEVYRLTVLRPGGNDTCLIAGIVPDADKRKRVNDAVMATYPTVEQVGFVDLDPSSPKLMMAGGEFCGNATRSTAWLALGGRPGELSIQVSGVSRKLRAGVTSNGEAFAEMPIYGNPKKISEDPDIPGNYIVEMEGITQYIDFRPMNPSLSQEQIKRQAFTFLQEKNLTRFPATGVIYSQQTAEGWKITPVVYVRDIDTLFYETACGSGTTALGMVLALKNGSSIVDVPIVQPTGLPIRVTVVSKGQSFDYAQISGPIEILQPLTNRVLSIQNSQKGGV